MLKVCVPELPERRELDGLPIEVVPFPDGRLDDVRLADVDVLVVPWWRQDEVRQLLPRLPRLRVVQTMTAGVEDLVGALPEGVLLCDAAGVHDVPVAEWTMAAILGMQRELPAFGEEQRRSRWRPSRAKPRELEGARVLIVGYGSIGRALEARLAPFGTDVKRIARRPREGVHGAEALLALLPTADVVVLLLPLTSATRRTFDEGVLGTMKDGALLVNAARGGLVDTDALVRELRAGRLRAALDATDPEPLPEGHPLWSAPGVLLTPHVAGASPRFHARAFRLVRRQLERLLAGEPPLNVVEEGY